MDTEMHVQLDLSEGAASLGGMTRSKRLTVNCINKNTATPWQILRVLASGLESGFFQRNDGKRTLV